MAKEIKKEEKKERFVKEVTEVPKAVSEVVDDRPELAHNPQVMAGIIKGE